MNFGKRAGWRAWRLRYLNTNIMLKSEETKKLEKKVLLANRKAKEGNKKRANFVKKYKLTKIWNDTIR